LDQKFGHFSRMFLSYDITFFTLLLHAFSHKDFVYRYESCIIHPIKKRRVKNPGRLEELAADITVYLAQKKIEDNISDEKHLKRIFYQMMAAAPLKWKRTKPLLNDSINKLFDELEKTEKLKIGGIDQTSNDFGQILGEVLAYSSEKLSIKLPKQARKLGFLMGKLIYLLDAYEDLEGDLRNWNYNPFIYENKEIILSCEQKEEAAKRIHTKEKWRLRLLLDHIYYSFSFLRDSLSVYRSEIDGIISKSLPAMVYRVIEEESTCQK